MYCLDLSAQMTLVLRLNTHGHCERIAMAYHVHMLQQCARIRFRGNWGGMACHVSTCTFSCACTDSDRHTWMHYERIAVGPLGGVRGRAARACAYGQHLPCTADRVAQQEPDRLNKMLETVNLAASTKQVAAGCCCISSLWRMFSTAGGRSLATSMPARPSQSLLACLASIGALAAFPC